MTSRVLLNISNLPWVPGRLKRNQAVFQYLLACSEAFSAGLFVNPPAIAVAPVKYRPIVKFRVIGSDRAGDKPVTIVQPVYGLPDWYIPTLRGRWARCIALELIRITDGPFWLWINSAGKLQHGIAMSLMRNAEKRVFDSSDDFTAWEAPDYRIRLQEIVACCEKLLCVNEHVAGTFEHRDKHVFHNCTDFDMFQRPASGLNLDPWLPKRLGAVYVGFTGGLNSTRVDLHLLIALFRRFPHWRFLFIGNTDNPAFLERLTAYPNAGFIPERPYHELPEIIRSFDVAIVPHADNATTRGNDLLKVLDYIACGVPVVSTRCSNVERYSNAIHIADSADQFGNLLEALVCGTIRHDPRPGLEHAATRSWKQQVPNLLPWLDDASPITKMPPSRNSNCSAFQH
jgi:glycosyltransferase involved in cell wall biosynthesis